MAILMDQREMAALLRDFVVAFDAAQRHDFDAESRSNLEVVAFKARVVAAIDSHVPGYGRGLVRWALRRSRSGGLTFHLAWPDRPKQTLCGAVGKLPAGEANVLCPTCRDIAREGERVGAVPKGGQS